MKKKIEDVHPASFGIARMIREKMFVNGETVTEIADLLQVSRGTMYRWLREPYEMRFGCIEVLAKHWEMNIADFTAGK